MPKPLWIVVANGSRARILQRDPPHEALREIKEWVHPQTRQHTPPGEGRHRTSGMRSRSGLAQRETAQDHARAQFAREISHWLDHQMPVSQVSSLALFASNPFLGELLAQGNGAMRRHVQVSHALDLTQLPVAELDARLQRDYGL